MTVLLVLLAVAFAYSMGAHYTGACMGVPHALDAVDVRRALLVMAPLTWLGATFVSHGVERTVGHDLLAGRGLSVTGLVIVVGIAFAVTSAFNRLAVPTSTIQILVFCVVGTGLAARVPVRWATIGLLAAIWVSAPVVAVVLGFLLTRLLDRTRLAEPEFTAARSHDWLAFALVAVGALASFAMGGNDVANATGSLVANHTFDPRTAGLIGGAGLAAGVLTWGRPLLRRVAFDIVTLDRPMATAAQLVQAGVVLGAVVFGFFTSMNQALIGALLGTGAARGRHTVHASTVLGILRGWVVGPAAGVALGYLVGFVVGHAAGTHTLTAAG